ncbi:MAG: hypothetical protein HQL51_03035 [Magnetococcales bacterium]|nr:hypothetical protein [Magnetococcales bacterium]
MSGAIAFDTYAFVKKMRDAGFSEPQAAIQAEALMALVEDRLATKTDLARVEAELKRDIKELDVRIATVEANLKRDIKELEIRLEARITTESATLRKEIAETKADLIKWMVGLAVAQLGLVGGLLLAILRAIPAAH